MLTFAELAAQFPQLVRQRLQGADVARLCELADRGDTAEIGRIFFFVLETAKGEAERAQADGLWPELAELVFTKRQAD